MAKTRQRVAPRASSQGRKHRLLATPNTDDANDKVPDFNFRHLDFGNKINQLSAQEKGLVLDKIVSRSSLTWQQLRNAPKDSGGIESIPRARIVAKIPEAFRETKHFVKMRVFNKVPLIGVQQGHVFHAVWVDAKRVVYSHGGS